MRPSSIITFERLFFISLALGLVGYFVNYDAAMAQLQADPNTAGMEMGGGFMLGAYLFGVAINLLLWYLIARRASNFARWIYAILAGAGAALTLPSLFATGFSLLTATTLVGIVLTAAMIVMLFRPDASDWFKGEYTNDPDVFS